MDYSKDPNKWQLVIVTNGPMKNMIAVHDEHNKPIAYIPREYEIIAHEFLEYKRIQSQMVTLPPFGKP